VANHRWYITSRGWTWAYEGSQAQRVPTLTSHAKGLGQTRTACGLDCSPWTKFWHLPYRPGVVGQSCPECDEKVRADGPRTPLHHS
jgi:hypothetical protein